jgi:hypothetical protein
MPKESDPCAGEFLKPQRNSDKDVPRICEVANAIVKQDIATALDNPSHPYASRRHFFFERDEK